MISTPRSTIHHFPIPLHTHQMRWLKRQLMTRHTEREIPTKLPSCYRKARDENVGQHLEVCNNTISSSHTINTLSSPSIIPHLYLLSYTHNLLYYDKTRHLTKISRCPQYVPPISNYTVALTQAEACIGPSQISYPCTHILKVCI